MKSSFGQSIEDKNGVVATPSVTVAIWSIWY